jgi:hypothetical protein
MKKFLVSLLITVSIFFVITLVYMSTEIALIVAGVLLFLVTLAIVWTIIDDNFDL